MQKTSELQTGTALTMKSHIPNNFNDLKHLVVEMASSVLPSPLDDIFDRTSVLNIFEADALSILRPSVHMKSTAQRQFGMSGLVFETDEDLLNIVSERTHLLGGFIGEARRAWLEMTGDELRSSPGGKDSAPVCVETLSGDSHNGARRPLLLKSSNNTKFVFKWAEPRTYLLLQTVLQYVQNTVGVPLLHPDIHVGQQGDWYAIPFLDEETGDTEPDVNGFMWQMGLLTAVAYCLRMVDLHLENVIVHYERPVIIDPECSLYMFEEMSKDKQLLNTGLLSHNIHLSALRGGGIPLWTLNQYVDEVGVLRYRSPTQGLRNRLMLKNGCYADPGDYQKVVLEGFRAGYSVFQTERGPLTEMLCGLVVDDLRVRFLVRKTRHYSTVLEMLNIPRMNDKQAWQDNVIQRFRASGSFLPEVPQSLLDTEISDLLRRDIPYFWFECGSNILMHRNHEVTELQLPGTIKSQLPDMLSSLNAFDLSERCEQLKSFLSAKLEESPETQNSE